MTSTPTTPHRPAAYLRAAHATSPDDLAIQR
jgi:hypothetical protein